DSNAQFRSERVSVSAAADLPDNAKGYVEVYYHPWAAASGLYLESAYYDTPVGSGRLRVGKGRNITFGLTPSYGNRKTSNYGIVAEAFTQDRIQGAQYTVDSGRFNLGLGVETGYRLGTRGIGEIPGDGTYVAAYSVPHLSFRDVPGSLSSTLQYNARASANLGAGLRAGASVLAGTVDDRDLASLQGTDTALRPRNPITGTTPTTAIGPGFTGKGILVSGLDLTYKRTSPLLLQGELFDASVSDLDYGAWSLTAGWEPPQGWKFYARYGVQDMNIVPTNNPLTWDTRQVSLSAVQPLRKALWLQYEYEINSEETDTGSKVADNLFFVELFSAF
ncbi:MAG: hypothetical protein PHT33_08525, partial [bacterium]|nr:hypothetical protein [bacterium]